MGKSGKERKRLKLLNVQAYSTQCESDDEIETVESDDTITQTNIDSTIAILDVICTDISYFKSPEMKVFRTTIGPLVNEQRDKHFERKKLPILSSNDRRKILNADDMTTALVVLSSLCSDMNKFRSKELKPLRTSLHPLVLELIGKAPTVKSQLSSVCAHIPVGGYSGRISAHLIANEWMLALEELHRMRQAKQAPKLGALQRWVRDADLAPAELRFPLIDAVLRVVEIISSNNQSIIPVIHETSAEDLIKFTQPVRKTLFVVPPLDILTSNSDKLNPLGNFDANHIKIVHTQLAADRPSRTDLNMYTIPSESFTLSILPVSSSSSCSGSRSINVPGVPGGFVIPHILSHRECDQWLHIANTMKFAPDSVVGINHVLWLAHQKLIDSLYERVKPHLPPSIDGCALAGINARLRFFRYEPGCEYRIHIDGAWPGSGFDSTGQPVDDIYGDRYSRLTFLIYLNDDFEGGHTTFFTPSSDTIGLLEASAVKPSKGSILCFPHGDAVGSLAHEGTSVIEGLKYVIRTDVLYMLPTVPATTGQKRKVT